MNRDQMDILGATREFHDQMTKAMLAAYFDGKQGWNDPNCKFWNGDFDAEILRRVAEKIQAGAKGNEVDIANYMMMLRYLRKLPVATHTHQGETK